MAALDQPPTIHDLARRLKVSSTTVWRALNGSPRVSQTTRKRVQAMARKLNYRPSLIAQTLSTGKTQTLGVIVPMIGNPVHAALVRGVEQVAFEHEYNIILCDTDFRADRERTYLDLLSRRRVEGVAVVHYIREESAPLDALIDLQKQGLAVVAMQVDAPDERVMSVVPDNAAAARAMTEHLIDLGHRRIAFLHGGIDAWNTPARQRLAGYRKALAARKIAYSKDLVVQAGAFEAALTDDTASFWPERVTAFIRNTGTPLAIFAPIDVLAIKIMRVIQSMNLRVPEDIAVAGFDDILMSGYTTPRLTTVRQPSVAIGRCAAMRLFEHLAGNANSAPLCVRVPCELVIRSSCGETTSSGRE
ncbi:MAG: LacI family DNA-binding transcriptional regulator [Tepidisphaeraceae bacterium]